MKKLRNLLSNKKVIIGIVVVLVALVIAAGLTMSNQKKQEKDKKAAQTKAKVGAMITKPKITKTAVCDDFNAEAAAKAMGAKVERVGTIIPEQKTAQTTYSTCIYRTVVAKGQTPRTLSIIVRTNKNTDVIKKTFTTLQTTLKGTVVNGLGDQAYFVTLSNQLNVRKGGTWLTIFVTKPASGQTASLDVAKSTAQTLLPKL